MPPSLPSGTVRRLDILQLRLRRGIAYAKWGTEGAYRVDAMQDGGVRQAVLAFSEAGKLLGTGH
ncbi:MAG: hypothetical protein ABJE10_16770 [bacterium]